MTHVLAILVLAAAADRKGPDIQHTAPAEARANQELVVEAKITDPSGVFEPRLYWRPAGSTTQFIPVSMSSGGKGRYTATIPSASVAGDLEYFLEAYDSQGNGPTRHGSSQAPLRVHVAVPVAQAAPAAEAFEPAGEAPEMVFQDVGPSFNYGAAITGGAGVAMVVAGVLLYYTAGASIRTIDGRYALGAGRSQEDHDATQSAMGRGFTGSILMLAGAGATAGGAIWWIAARPKGPMTLGLTVRF